MFSRYSCNKKGCPCKLYRINGILEKVNEHTCNIKEHKARSKCNSKEDTT